MTIHKTWKRQSIEIAMDRVNDFSEDAAIQTNNGISKKIMAIVHAQLSCSHCWNISKKTSSNWQQKAGFEEDQNNVEELLVYDEELPNEECLELEQQRSLKEKVNNIEPPPLQKDFQKYSSTMRQD